MIPGILIAYISYQNIDPTEQLMQQEKQLKKMEQRIETIKLELHQIGSMRPGSLNKQFTVCGRPGCRCQDQNHPKRHGPYVQLSYVHQGKSTTQFIQKELVPTVTQQLKNFKKFKALTTEWVDLALVIAKEKLAADRARIKAPTSDPRP
jgi:hypothetical protein